MGDDDPVEIPTQDGFDFLESGNGPAVRTASLVERRRFEPPVLFSLFHLGRGTKVPPFFGHNLPAHRSENNSLIGFSRSDPA